MLFTLEWHLIIGLEKNYIMNKHFKFPFWNPEMEQAVSDFIKSVQVENTKDFGWSWTRPMANVDEFTDRYEISLAAPGLAKIDFKISFDQNILKIEADKPKTENDAKHIKNEFNFNKFTRGFKIHEDVDTNNISATYENGILLVTLKKKAEAAQGPKTIVIS